MEDDVVFYLDIEDVIALYADLLGCTEPVAINHIRSWDGLESALARAENYAHYEDADLALQAAALAHGIAEGQHFLDGNKRLALLAMRTFLVLNSYQITASQEERAAWIWQLSAGGDIEELADRIRDALMPIE